MAKERRVSFNGFNDESFAKLLWKSFKWIFWYVSSYIVVAVTDLQWWDNNVIAVVAFLFIISPDQKITSMQQMSAARHTESKRC